MYKYEHKLTCRYVRHHPIFYISPLKEEVFYLKPRIVVYHNAITDSEIETAKELATSRVRTFFFSVFYFKYDMHQV